MNAQGKHIHDTVKLLYFPWMSYFSLKAIFGVFGYKRNEKVEILAFCIAKYTEVRWRVMHSTGERLSFTWLLLRTLSQPTCLITSLGCLRTLSWNAIWYSSVGIPCKECSRLRYPQSRCSTTPCRLLYMTQMGSYTRRRRPCTITFNNIIITD